MGKTHLDENSEILPFSLDPTGYVMFDDSVTKEC